MRATNCVSKWTLSSNGLFSQTCILVTNEIMIVCKGRLIVDGDAGCRNGGNTGKSPVVY